MEDLKVVELDPSTWDRGREFDIPTAKNPDSFISLSSKNGMCCLGFAAIQLCGATQDEIEMVGIPSECSNSVEWPEYLVEPGYEVDTELTKELIKINDREGLDDKNRVEQLNQALKEAKAPIRFSLREVKE